MSTGVRLVYMTVGSEKEAVALGRAVVQERLAACANVIPRMTSIYEWQGELHEDAECLVLMKTSAEGVGALRERLVELHSYECPCVVDFELEGGHSAFLKWVGEQTGVPGVPA